MTGSVTVAFVMVMPVFMVMIRMVMMVNVLFAVIVSVERFDIVKNRSRMKNSGSRKNRRINECLQRNSLNI